MSYEMVTAEKLTYTAFRGSMVFSVRIVDGEVVIDELTKKEAAIDEIKAQPFFSPKHLLDRMID
jgi:hypothetical protein